MSCQTKPQTIEVIFDTQGGTAIEQITITKGEAFSIPANPTKEGYSFSGWYVDNETYLDLFTTAYDLSKITSNSLTLYAKWIINTYTITFNTNGGETMDSVTENFNTTLPVIEDPSKMGFTFDGWYEDQALSIPFTKTTMPAQNLTLYAKWSFNTYTIIFEENGGSDVSDITQIYQSTVEEPTPPTKEGYTFLGWFSDELLETAYTFTIMPAQNLTLYAKWEEVIIDNSHLATETLPYFSSLYGNTNGNLNNLGLAVYDNKRALHYFSIASEVYQYNPSTDETSFLFSLISGGRATYLNLDNDVLYYIDTNDGFVNSYHLVNQTFQVVHELETSYLSRTQTWVNLLYPVDMYGEIYMTFRRYYPATQTFSATQGTGYEQMNISGTRVYYKPITNLSLSVMSENGSGKSNIVYLTNFDVTEQYETLLYKVDNSYVAYFGLILEIGQTKGLYLYNANDGLVKVMDGNFHSLNYDGNALYAMLGNSLYRINPETKVAEVIYTLSVGDYYLNLVNHWIYIGSQNSTALYRINPVTEEIESG